MSPPSTTPCDAVVDDLAGLPIAIERLPGRDGLGDILVLRAGPTTAARGVLVMSHLDTVHPIGTLAHDLPLRTRGRQALRARHLRHEGRGLSGARGLQAGGAWRASARLPMTFLFTPDEEIGSPTSRALIEDFARTSAYALVTEPGRDGGKVVTGRKGVGRFDVHVEGRPAHSGARHEAGRSAIREAARQILAVEALTDYARGVTTTVGMMQGGTAANVIPQHRALLRRPARHLGARTARPSRPPSSGSSRTIPTSGSPLQAG